MFESIQHIHFVGIGGSGMSGIAEVLLNLGYIVTGSDAKKSDVTDRLTALGAKIFLSHASKNIGNADVIVTSTAIDKNNVEVAMARCKKIPVIPRAEMLAELMRLKYAVLVAGTHGKTTTTSLTSWVMSKAGMDPTIVIGGKFNNIGTGAKLGQGKFIVAEADESDGSFLKLSPTVAIVTNIDNDHLDHYKTMDNLQHAFVTFIEKIPFYGFAVLCNDDARLRSIIPTLNRTCFTYGIARESTLMAHDISVTETQQRFTVWYKNKKLGVMHLPVPGKHNVLNALAATMTSLELGVPFATVCDAMADFKGVGRRLEIKGETDKGVLVIDDYGHHPREMAATYQSVHDFWKERKKFVVFQPHRYTRTELLAKEFADVLCTMDTVILLPIYPAGEKPIKGISQATIVNHIPRAHRNRIVVLKHFDDALPYLLNTVPSKSLVLTLGAGNVVTIGEQYLKQMQN